MASEIIDLTSEGDLTHEILRNLEEASSSAERAEAKLKTHLQLPLFQSSRPLQNSTAYLRRPVVPGKGAAQLASRPTGSSDCLIPLSLQQKQTTASRRHSSETFSSELGGKSRASSSFGGGRDLFSRVPATADSPTIDKSCHLRNTSPAYRRPHDRSLDIDSQTRGQSSTKDTRTDANPEPPSRATNPPGLALTTGARPSRIDAGIGLPQKVEERTQGRSSQGLTEGKSKHERRPAFEHGCMAQNSDEQPTSLMQTLDFDFGKLGDHYPQLPDESQRPINDPSSLHDSASADAPASKFPSNFDRGRFPKERRRRGGKKYGTSRINGFSKTQSNDDNLEEAPRAPPVDESFRARLNTSKVSWTGKELDEVVKFCLTIVAPAVEKQSRLRTESLTAKQRGSIEKHIINSAIGHPLLQFLEEHNFNISNRQRKEIKRYLRQLYSSKAKLFISHRDGLGPSSTIQKENIPWASFSSRNFANGNSNSELEVQAQAKVVQTQNRVQPVDDSNRDYHDGAHCAAIVNRAEQTDDHTVLRNPLDLGLPDSNLQTFREKAVATFSKPGSETMYSSQRQRRKHGTGNTSSKPPALSRRPRPSYFQNQELNGIFEESDEAGDVVPAKGPSHQERPRHINTKPHVMTQPKTFDRPELEAQIARVMLDPSSGDISGHQLDVQITLSDSERLLQQTSIFKNVTWQRQDRKKKLTMISTSVLDPVAKEDKKLSNLLRHRELGTLTPRSGFKDAQITMLQSMTPWKKWKGASSDIVSVAWKPDSSLFVVGAAAHTNAEDLQYNRPCNLMLGNLEANMIWELPDHRTKRPKPDTIQEGPNSLLGTYNACDPMVYQTVNAVAFSRDGERMYSASRDHTLKIWNCNDGQTSCQYSLDHEAVVACLDIYQKETNIFATACQIIDDSIQVFHHSDDQLVRIQALSSSRAQDRPSYKMLPECIRFGSNSHSSLLLAGFSQWAQFGSDEFSREGHLCLWDVERGAEIIVRPSSQSVNSVAWHPYSPIFAAGGATGTKLRHTKYQSVIRTYDARSLTRAVTEFDTQAYEIQDVTYHPHDANIVTAGCTNGKTFVWDYRRQDSPLHTLCHGEPLMELDAHSPREETDTGVRLSAWGPEGSIYYSGSSDGVVKAWDIRRHPADVLIRNVAHLRAAIQDGAFSPDFSHLLVGDADGGIHILSHAPTTQTMLSDSDDDQIVEEEMLFTRAPDGSGKRLNLDDDNPGTEGIEAANLLVSSGQIDVHPIFGPGQGENYLLPSATDERTIAQDRGLIQKLHTWEGSTTSEVEASRIAHATMRRSLLLRQTDLHGDDGKVYEGDSKNDHAVLTYAQGSKSLHARRRRSPQHNTLATQLACVDRDLQGAVVNTISEEEMLEEDFWFPHLGAKEIQKVTGSHL